MDTKQIPLTKTVSQGVVKVNTNIHGSMNYSKNSKIEIKSVQIFLKGNKEVFATIIPTTNDFGASFDYMIEAQARAGDYEVVWQTYTDGKEAKIVNEFSIDADGLDRTLPIELQHLK